jgi:pyridinium-3,5-biscarboxylic acid mononucleotide synthase
VSDPLRDLRHALSGAQPAVEQTGHARLDVSRDERTGVPEVILAEYKTAEQTVAIARSFLERRGRAIISRVPDATLAALEQHCGAPVAWQRYEQARLVVLRLPEQQRPRTGGRVGVITAGTADVPAAQEAAALCEEMGCEVQLIFDVGVAGLHRLIAPLAQLQERPVDALVVAAGMDGALPSVVAGLVDVPVIGLPTSTGYGMGGRGEAALLSMLQTCAPGLAVVNIDNGIGAGAMAALIANRVAAARGADFFHHGDTERTEI